MNAIALLMFVMSGVAQSKSPTKDVVELPEVPAAERAAWSVQEREEASRLAAEYAGVEAPRLETATVTLVQSIKDETPFVYEAIVARPLWRVTFSGWSVGPIEESPPGARDWYGPRELQVLLDPVNGSVLKVYTTPAPGSDLPRVLDAKAAEGRLSSNERYHGIAKSPPLITFADAIRAVQRGGGNPRAAKQISAVWVNWSRMGSPPKPMWIITLKGIPAEPLDQMRYVIDPVERKWVFASTGP